MRKFYLLLTLILGIYKANSQDTASFNYNIGINNNVEFINTSHLHGDAYRKAWWSFGDGTRQMTAPLANTSHHYNNAGTYTACLRIYKYLPNSNDSILSAESCKTFTIGSTATPDSCKADFTNEPATSASSLMQRFNAIPWHNHNKKPERICWHFGDGTDTCINYDPAISNNYVVYHHYSQPGQYNVCVKIKYQGGCESEKCKMVTVAQPPVDSCYVNVFEVATNLNNLVRHFYAGLMPNRTAERICWYFGDGTDTCYNLPNPVTSQSLMIEHHYPAPGVYHVCVKVKYVGGCEAQKCREVVIRASTNLCGGYMTDSVTGPRTFKFRGYSIMNPNDHVISWRWTFGDGTTATTQDPSHTYLNGGNYEVCLYIRTDLGCETRICKHIIIQGQNQPQLQLTPNPVINILHALFFSTFQEQVNITIYNANGVIVRTYTRPAVVGANNWDFEVGSLPAGIYSVIVSSPHQLANAIFFKQ